MGIKELKNFSQQRAMIEACREYKGITKIMKYSTVALLTNSGRFTVEGSQSRKKTFCLASRFCAIDLN